MSFAVTLAAGGGYTCTLGTLRYVGSWSVDAEGRFWITESCRPEDARSWCSYAVRFAPGSLTGQVEGNGAVPVRLERRNGRHAGKD